MSIAGVVAGLMQKIKETFAGLFRAEAPAEAVGEFETRYRAFQELLEQNNRVLELLADLEEKRSGEYLFDRQYTESRLAEVSSALDRMIERLNVLSQGKYRQLSAIHAEIQSRVWESISHAHTQLVMTLEKALQWVVPLNLPGPDAEEFKPESCRTLHDLTRFSHEKAKAEMFSIGDAYDGRSRTITLSAGIPVRAHLYDISGGVKPGLRVATSADILSVPFSAFLRGMKSMRWPGPPPADVKGFLGMIAHTAEMSEEELRRTAEKSFAVVSAKYMNFSIRLGYHFSQVEAYVGENLNDNYIKFLFSGGGAVRDRRLRRVRLIKEILATMDFHITLSDDVIRAELPKYRRPALEARLEVMGKLTAYTKQLDMTLFNDSITDWYIEEFISEHVTPRKDLKPEISASP